MGISQPRDLDVLRHALTGWLRAWRPEARDVRVAPLQQPPTGLSSETFMMEVDWHLDGAPRHASLVARLPPDGEGLFPAYDIAGQGRIQGVLAAAGLPAVAPLAVEEDDGWLGAPFLLMPKVAGRVVRADVPFLRTGWLAEATPAGQARLHAELVGALAGIHRLDWAALGCDRLLAPRPGTGAGRSRLGPELEHWAGYLTWAGGGAVPAVYEEAVAWCRANLPGHEPPPSLLWGDVQLGNVLVAEDMGIAALLDFEMASIGPAELDLGWFLVLHRMSVDRCGGDLPGFPGRPATVSAYEAALGRSVADLRWYEVFAALRSGAVMVRAARLLARLGVDDSWLTRANPTIALLAELTAG